jgi:voltage-gated potassium channel
VVNFIDQMLRGDDSLRVEEVTAPTGFEPTALGELAPKSSDYLLMATRTHGKWVFNPADDHIVRAGTTLVLMTTPGGREHMEKRLRA